MPRFDRSSVIHVGLAIFALAIIGKAAQVQIWQRDQWLARAARLHFDGDTIPAPRGVITDASGRVLVESRELVRLRVAPRELRDRAAVGGMLRKAKVPNDWVRRAVDTTRKWVEIPGAFLPSDVATITAQQGIHSEPIIQRVSSGAEGIMRIVGRVTAGGAVDGVELALDSMLSGVRGTSMVLRDARGSRLDSPFGRGDARSPTQPSRWARPAVTSSCSTRATARFSRSPACVPIRARRRRRR
jgi:cell division protein FtsI (penicillin-binding protein 3)